MILAIFGIGVGIGVGVTAAKHGWDVLVEKAVKKTVKSAGEAIKTFTNSMKDEQ